MISFFNDDEIQKAKMDLESFSILDMIPCSQVHCQVILFLLLFLFECLFLKKCSRALLVCILGYLRICASCFNIQRLICKML